MSVKLKTFEDIRQSLIESVKVKYLENANLPNINDFNVGSVMNTLIEALSDVMEGFYYDIYSVVGESLDNIYAGLNFYRKPARKATCVVTFYIKAALGVIVGHEDTFSIPRGTVVSNGDGTQEFEVLDEYSSLKATSASGDFAGYSQYTVYALSKIADPTANITANTITKISENSTITNINGYPIVLKNESASGATVEESVEDYKLRFKKYLFSLRRGTEEAIRYALDTNAAFSGFMYNLDKYEPLTILKQFDATVPPIVDVDFTDTNKYSSDYYILEATVDPLDPNELYLYFGAEDKFYNLMFVSNALDKDEFQMMSMEYYDSNTETWAQIQEGNTNIEYGVTYISTDQYIYWDISDKTSWGRFQFSKYDNYFMRIKVKKILDETMTVFKAMTYPFPGYIDVYCLKNYREPITTSDKVLVSEAIEDFKAAGVISTISSADVTQLYPTIVFYCTPQQIDLIPSDFQSKVQAEITNYANNIQIGEKFSRSDFYAYMSKVYGQYGSIFIFYQYDGSVVENSFLELYREGFRSLEYNPARSEKADMNFTNVLVLENMNKLSSVMTGDSTYDYYYTDYNSVAF